MTAETFTTYGMSEYGLQPAGGEASASSDLFAKSAAYLRGVSDTMSGKSSFDCPFKFGSAAHSEWMLGHAAAVVRGFGKANVHEQPPTHDNE